MQQKKLIISIIALFVLSSAYLLWTARNYNDPDYEKNWWALYFENPKSDDLDFVIENHSDKTGFHYVLTVGNDKIKEEDVSINKGETKKLSFGDPLKLSFEKNKKTTVQVISGEERKEIYKNFDK